MTWSEIMKTKQSDINKALKAQENAKSNKIKTKCPHCKQMTEIDYAGKEGKIVRFICTNCNEVFKYQMIGGENKK